jgi:hypothetical protein
VSNTSKPHPLFEHRLEALARLITALRARESASSSPVISDPYAEQPKRIMDYSGIVAANS